MDNVHSISYLQLYILGCNHQHSSIIYKQMMPVIEPIILLNHIYVVTSRQSLFDCITNTSSYDK